MRRDSAPAGRGLLLGMKTNISAPGCAKRVAQLLSLGAIGLVAGCSSYPESHVVSAPPPPPPGQAATVYSMPVPAQPTTHVVTTPQGTYAVPSPVGASSVIVMQAPPQAQQEVPTPRPSRDHVWVAGAWTWRNSRYEWMPGHWEIPPRAGAVWVPARWQPEGSSYRFYEGYWD